MQRRHLLAASLPTLVGGLLSSPTARATDFPSKPITLVVPFGAGGVADITARTVGQAMAPLLGQAVVVDNRPGAGGIVATQAVLSAPADGHTLLLMSNATAVSVHLVKKLPFDVQKQLLPITTLGFFELGVAVPAQSPFKNLKELVAHAKAKPGKLSIGTISVGSTQHLSAELFKAKAGIDAVVVPYKGSPAVVNALRTGEIDVAFEILSPLLPQLQAKVIRLLAVTGTQRFAGLAEVPTAIEQGLPDYTVDSWNALAAPVGTPAAAIERTRAAAAQAVAQPGVAAKLAELGVKAKAGSPAELAQLLASEIQHWGQVVRAAKIEAE